MTDTQENTSQKSRDEPPPPDPATDPRVDIHAQGVYRISGQVLTLWIALTVIYGLKAVAFIRPIFYKALGNVATVSFLMLIAGFVVSWLVWRFKGRKPFFGQIGGIVATAAIYVIFTIILFATATTDTGVEAS